MVPPVVSVAIVGAGMHAVAVAVRLLQEWPGLREGLRLVDPAGTCLSDWRRRTWGQGMETMRSPGAHHLDVAPESLLDYARAQGRERELLTPYHRPSLQLFMDHCRWVIGRYRIEELIIPAQVVEIQPHPDGYGLACSDGTTVHAPRLVLAPGLRYQERLPAWAPGLSGCHPKVAAHVESLDVRHESIVGERILVVGGGLSAATLAAAAAERGARVTLLSRRRLEARLFDADPGWVGPKYLRFFQSEPEPAARLRMVQRARGRGSVTPELLERLRRRQAEGRLRIVEEGELLDARYDDRRTAVSVTLSPERRVEQFDRVWCGTGYDPSLTRLAWLGPLRDLPHCQGRPLVGPTLELAPSCFVTGWLAELWVGPAARNIAGARHAAGLIVQALRGRSASLGAVEAA